MISIGALSTLVLLALGVSILSIALLLGLAVRDIREGNLW